MNKKTKKKWMEIITISIVLLTICACFPTNAKLQKINSENITNSDIRLKVHVISKSNDRDLPLALVWFNHHYGIWSRYTDIHGIADFTDLSLGSDESITLDIRISKCGFSTEWIEVTLHPSPTPTMVTMELNPLVIDKVDTVEFTVQIFGIEGVGKHMVQFTSEKAEELKNLFDNLETRLDNAEERQERIEIFKEIVMSLDELGLLPEGVSVEDLQELVTKTVVKHRSKNLANRNNLCCKSQINIDDENFNCLVVGNTLGTKFFKSSIGLSGLITFGDTGMGAYSQSYPSNGWVHTDGLKNVKKWHGDFYGQLGSHFDERQYHIGVKGFDGISISETRVNGHDYWGDSYFFGSALRVKIGPSPFTEDAGQHNTQQSRNLQLINSLLNSIKVRFIDKFLPIF